MFKHHMLLWVFLLATQSTICAQEDLQQAPWITYPTASVNNYGVYHFRKSINLKELPEKLIIHVSADNRYNLFVNGKRIAYGPAKGDMQTYHYDVIDIAPYLEIGKNSLAALVYNGGKDKPFAFISAQTAFMLYPRNKQFNELQTDSSWKTYKNPAYQPISYKEMIVDNRWFYGAYYVGPGDNVDGSKHPWGWEDVDFDDSNWSQAEVLEFDGNVPWNLVERTIPFMDTHIVNPESIRLFENVDGVEDFLKGKSNLIIPENTTAKVLFDFKNLTMGYPELTVNGGKESQIKINYAEALYDDVNLKTHRDSVIGKTMYGSWDLFKPDGAINRTFRPLWKRTFRYVQFTITTKNQPLTISNYQCEYSGYPYTEMATFESNETKLNEIFEMGLRTLQMCSAETYYDTPFYEQLSYGGDNRPIAALSMYTSTDDRLLREALRIYSQSQGNETGLLRSSYPSRHNHDMATWSLAWAQTLYDYYLMRADTEFVSQFVNNIERILEFYERHIDEELQILGTLANRNFMDWSITESTIPRRNEKKEVVNSTMLTLFYIHTLDCVTQLYDEIGEQSKANKWKQVAHRLKEGVRNTSWNQEKQLFSDSPNSGVFSQHTNILAILCDIVPKDEQIALFERILNYKQFDEYASSFFSFFLFKAMKKTNQEDLFLDNLEHWYNFIDRGYTTMGETGFASHDRSDCHAWSAHPSYYLLNFVCGINSSSVGFETIKIEPHLGNLKTIKASMPHNKGRIKLDYQIKRNKLWATVTLPEDLYGTFVYNQKSIKLSPGVNILKGI